MASRSAAVIESLYSPRARDAPPINGAPEFPVTVNFDQGFPDPRYFPVEAIQRDLVATLDADGVDALRYFGAGGASEMQYGYVGLRTQLAQWMARRDGRDVGGDGVTLVNGS